VVTIAHPMQFPSGRAAGALLAGALLFAACQGPTLTIDGPPAPDEHAACYLDGQEVPRGKGPQSRPLPYYGTAALDTVPPAGDAGPGDFQKVPHRTAIEVPEPVTPWLFPFDFLLEGVGRVLHGRDDHVVRGALAANPAPARTGLTMTGADDVRRRALQARTSR
jgi:hypothetical protein